MSDWRQQQEQDELQLHLWYSLMQLRSHISAEVFQAAERELGFDTRESNHGCVQANSISFGGNGEGRHQQGAQQSAAGL